MSRHRFVRYELRTTDVDAARAFYPEIFGPDFWGPDLIASPLPAAAAARGAPAHWLGHIAVTDVEETAARATAGGAERLGPSRPIDDAKMPVVLRDPFGAVVALGATTAAPARNPVVWHLSHSTDHDAAFAWYAALFGWTETASLDLGPERGRLRMFGWDESGRSVGAMSDTARQPGIHPQWLYFFPVADIERAMVKVRAAGGLALPSIRTPAGDLVAPCDDPQGAAFGLYQAPR